MLIIQVLEGKQCRPSVDRDKTARDEPPSVGSILFANSTMSLAL